MIRAVQGKVRRISGASTAGKRHSVMDLKFKRGIAPRFGVWINPLAAELGPAEDLPLDRAWNRAGMGRFACAEDHPGSPRVDFHRGFPR